jgi:hypothetical protein
VKKFLKGWRIVGHNTLKFFVLRSWFNVEEAFRFKTGKAATVE